MHFGPPGVPWLKVFVGFLCTQNWLVGWFVKVEFVDDMFFVVFFSGMFLLMLAVFSVFRWCYEGTPDTESLFPNESSGTHGGNPNAHEIRVGIPTYSPTKFQN